MKRDEAQFILTAYRPGGEDAASETFLSALQMAETDPELRQWFAQEQTMDQLVSEKLRQVQPPADLRERILMGGRVSQRDARFRVAKWLAWAAALLLFSVVATNFVQPPQHEVLGTFAINYVDQGFDLENEGTDLSELQAWLKNKEMPTPGSVPGNLANLERLGCRTAEIDGKKVSVICFKGDQEYHLFVMRRSDFPKLAVASGKRMEHAGRWTAVSWSDATNNYAVVSEASEAAIRHLL